MIELIEITNFQPYEYTMLELSPGVNVIKGQTHAGKTSAMRALRWAIRNKPRGEGFKSKFARPSDTVSVGIVFTDENSIVREKGKKNQYIANDHVMSAVSSDVPDEVSSVMNMSDINIHTQLDGPFLLTKSPGVVARDLNEAVGLNIIDDLMRAITRIVHESRRWVEQYETIVLDTEQKIKSLSWLDKAKPEIERLQNLEEQQQILYTDKKNIHDVLNRSHVIQTSIDGLKSWLTIEEPFEELSKIAESAREKKTQFNRINNILIEREKVFNRLDKTKILLGLEGLVQTLIDNRKKASKHVQNSVKLINICSGISQAKTSIRNASREVREGQKMFKETLKRMGICPMCGRKVKQ